MRRGIFSFILLLLAESRNYERAKKTVLLRIGRPHPHRFVIHELSIS